MHQIICFYVSNFRRVLVIIAILLGISLLKMEPIQGSETSTFNNNLATGKYPEELLSDYKLLN